MDVGEILDDVDVLCKQSAVRNLQVIHVGLDCVHTQAVDASFLGQELCGLGGDRRVRTLSLGVDAQVGGTIEPVLQANSWERCGTSI